MKGGAVAHRSRSSRSSRSDAADSEARSHLLRLAKEASDSPDVRIGISGWNYRPWRGTFYPKGLVQKQELAFASRQVNSIEINGSFYSLQRPNSYRLWYDQTPPNFVFSVKGGRFITHLKRLQNVETPLANFFASGILLLREKLGPILWQLPPHFAFHREKLANFFHLLPRDTEAAAKLSERHDQRVDGRSWTKTDQYRKIRYAIEVRHESFKCVEFVQLLREHEIGLVIADTAGKWPFFEDTTADLVYARLHGDAELYVSGYSDDSLAQWSKKLKGWSEGKNPKRAQRVAELESRPPPKRDIYVYFDNDVKVRAPFDAMSLAHKLGIGPKPGAPPDASNIAEVARIDWAAVRQRWPGGKAKPTRNRAARKS